MAPKIQFEKKICEEILIVANTKISLKIIGYLVVCKNYPRNNYLSFEEFVDKNGKIGQINVVVVVTKIIRIIQYLFDQLNLRINIKNLLICNNKIYLSQKTKFEKIEEN